MNKLEAIKELEGLKTIGNDARAACYNEGINAGITIIKQLDEPQKAVIQQFVADLVDWTVRSNWAPSDVIREFQTNTPDTVNLPETLELEKLGEYFEKAYCRYEFERACILGYEVEKEPLYYVTLPDTDKDSEVVYALEKKRDGNIEISLVNRRKLGVSDSTKLSEQEIKSVDERYQLFAKEIAK
ncbi:DUF1642 domain-containing protein [Enterococcus faecium]|uniref:DUF1642 domain-containing protein n=1 Tax=Enterococcus faecium TaxID=1352 RepID=UPI0022E2D293|nr:DUF1642 domain-containing protein [Enterococcus faecium]MDQ8291606.1 DUF1642 domain-containing protein [Enterococcus faecium]